MPSPFPVLVLLLACCFCSRGGVVNGLDYAIVDTAQKQFYDATKVLATAPATPATAFYGQDAQISGAQPSYKDNGDQTVTDQITNLMWPKAPLAAKKSFDEAVAGASTFTLGGHSDWRLPSIKELYSLIIFSGRDPSGWSGTDTSTLVPFINTTVFTFAYGDTTAGERIIDSQYVSSTQYVSTTMNNDATVFGVNFADGRIKGYPKVDPMSRSAKKFAVLYVRSNPKYGINRFVDNSDNTVTDQASNLMWAKYDSGKGMAWLQALAYVTTSNTNKLVGYADWRMPNIKELQSIIDYTRSPATTSSAAINPIFNITSMTNEGGIADYPYFWSGTTHASMNAGTYASYVAFGRALGYMSSPGSTTKTLLDVHGAGSQRSDPKEGSPSSFPTGHGPQGDVIRIYNFVRLVRDGGASASTPSTPTPTSPGTTPTPAPPGTTPTPAPPGTTPTPPGTTPAPNHASSSSVVSVLSIFSAMIVFLTF